MVCLQNLTKSPFDRTFPNNHNNIQSWHYSITLTVFHRRISTDIDCSYAKNATRGAGRVPGVFLRQEGVQEVPPELSNLESLTFRTSSQIEQSSSWHCQKTAPSTYWTSGVVLVSVAWRWRKLAIIGRDVIYLRACWQWPQIN